jgi:hypothetical protein
MEKRKARRSFDQRAFFISRQRPTFPLPHGSSIIGLGGLNFRVRDGNGWNPSGMTTGNFKLNSVSEDHVCQKQCNVMLSRTTD